MRFTHIAVGLSLLLGAASPAWATAGSPEGNWITNGGKSVVRFDRCGTGWCGRIFRILRPDPGAADRDVRNPDPRLRAHPLLGLQIITLDSVSGEQWRGSVYDPRSGKSYRALVRRTGSNQLELQGCLLVFCQTQRWSAAGPG